MAYRATHRRLAVGLAALAVLTSGLAACTSPAARFEPGAGATGAGRPTGTSTAAATDAAHTTFTLSAVGDTIMASAPKFLPPNGGRGLFAPVESALGADLQMANLEEPITDATTSPKCGNPPAANCFAYRAP